MRLNILCEGQTEEAFVNRVLRPHLAELCIYPVARLVPTRKSSNSRAFKGGWLSYDAVKKELTSWMMAEHGPNVWFTTMLDLYAIPRDFPDIDKAGKIASPHDRVDFLEKVFHTQVVTDELWRFIPYLQLHEFEALIFADPSKLDCDYFEHATQIEELLAMAKKAGDPELINDNRETAPSKRIRKMIPEYDKVRSGARVAEEIGLPTLRMRCRHFGRWLTSLEETPTREPTP